MNSFKNSLDWYQAKIGDHDKQYWEQSVEGRINKTIDSLPKRDYNHTEQNRELLDIDIIKGSTFTKAVPSHTVFVRTWKGLVRILFLPFFYNWWVRHTTWKFFVTVLLLYASQVFVTVVYCYSSINSSAAATLFEVTNPLMFMFVLSVMHTQIVYTKSSAKTNLFKKASTAKGIVPSASKRILNVKRVKKNTSKNGLKRKSKSASRSDSFSKAIDPARSSSMSSGLKPSSDSSEEVDGMRPLEQHQLYDDTLDGYEDEGSVCSGDDDTDQRLAGIDNVPDVAVDAEERHSPLRSATVSKRLRLDLPGKGVEPDLADGGESDGTTDLDSPNKAGCTSDTEWENSSHHIEGNWVCNSDVADSSTDSSSEYLSDDHHEDELGVDRPISLKKKPSHSLAYVPSFYDRISCIIWEKGQCKKVDLSVLELGGQIERQVASIDYDSSELLLCALSFTLLIASFPFLFRLYYSPKLTATLGKFIVDSQVPDGAAVRESLAILLGSSWQELVIIINGVIQRLFLCGIFCFLVSVAEKSYWQKLQFAKFFCYLTSARRSRKHGVPHFRLNKVKNIKIWLSLRAYLKKRGPQRSVEVIVGSVFGLMVAFLAAMCVQLLSDIESFIQVYGNWELTLCCLALTCYLLRFYSLGTKITKKYRNLSTIITEQMNLYLHMEQKPHKKEELLVANAVLKLAESLIKEIESPYKMSSTLINPVVFNVTRVAMLSAFSAIVSELLGFKLKLHKVKI